MCGFYLSVPLLFQKKQCTYCFASYNVSSQMTKIEGGREHKQADITKENRKAHASGYKEQNKGKCKISQMFNPASKFEHAAI